MNKVSSWFLGCLVLSLLYIGVFYFLISYVISSDTLVKFAIIGFWLFLVALIGNITLMIVRAVKKFSLDEKTKKIHNVMLLIIASIIILAFVYSLIRLISIDYGYIWLILVVGAVQTIISLLVIFVVRHFNKKHKKEVVIQVPTLYLNDNKDTLV